MKNRNAYFAGGCFWCITPVFADSKGVIKVTSGYCGGDEVNPTYEDVKHQLTKHRETIRIEYDADVITYRELLNVFIDNVDPLDGEGQFIDKGYSYTLAIYYHDDEEYNTASQVLKQLEIKLNHKPYIALEKLKEFYEAEEYHQDYYLKNPEAFEEELIKSGRK